MRRIGLFGGTFDPIHLGHLRTVIEIRQNLGLDTIYLIPAAYPPHKRQTELTSTSDRLKMTLLAARNNPGILVSDIELTREGPSYSIDTIRHFISRGIEPENLFLILGSDAFFELHTWRSYEEIVQEVSLIVVDRCMPLGNRMEFSASVASYVRNRISTGYEYLSQKKNLFNPATGRHILLTWTTCLGISATQIRSLVKEGRSIRYLVPDCIEEYIFKKGLYRK